MSQMPRLRNSLLLRRGGHVTSIRTQVIYPARNKMGMWSEAAGELVLGTAIVESNLTYLKQHGEGPALGLWQVEPLNGAAITLMQMLAPDWTDWGWKVDPKFLEEARQIWGLKAV
jgi:hypothetical protein